MMRSPPPPPLPPPSPLIARFFTWPKRQVVQNPSADNSRPDSTRCKPELSVWPSPPTSIVTDAGSSSDILSEVLPVCGDVDGEVEILYKSEAPIFLANLEVDKEMKVRIVNLERWRIHPTYYTLDFQIVYPEVEASYVALAEEMKAFYEGTRGARYELSPEIMHRRKMDFAVIRTGNGEFKRISVVRLGKGEKWEFDPEDEEDQGIELLGRTSSSDESDQEEEDGCGVGMMGDLYATLGQDGNNDCASSTCSSDVDEDNHMADDPRVVLVDENVNLPRDLSGITWFYLLDRFCVLPFKTWQFFLTDSGNIQDLEEYRDEAAKLLAEVDALDCKVDRINKNGVPFVTLRSPKWPKTINEIMWIKTVEAFPAASVPPVGEIRSRATLSHCNDNGEIFLQFKQSYMFTLFQRIEAGLSEEKYLEAKADGPYVLQHNKFYLAPFDGWYYRCQITGPIIPEFPTVRIIFSDYGNSDVRDKSELVPCVDVDEVFNAFPKQAARAHLRNIGRVDWNRVMEYLPKNKTYVVETMSPRTDANVACVELLSTKGLNILMLSESLLEGNYAVAWSDELLDVPLVYKQTMAEQFIPSLIPMRTTNWAEADSKIVLAEPGAIIEVIITSIDKYGIRASTAYAEKRLGKLGEKMKDWYYWYYVEILSDARYTKLMEDMIGLGKCFILGKYPGKNNPRDNVFTRVRLLACKKGIIIVHSVDAGTKEECTLSHLHPMDDKFCELPAQGAELSLNGFEEFILNQWHQALDMKMAGKKYLVKVEEVTYEEKSERCHIKGDLYPIRAFGSVGDPKFPERVIRSKGPEEAEGVDLGEPLSHKHYLEGLTSNFRDQATFLP